MFDALQTSLTTASNAVTALATRLEAGETAVLPELQAVLSSLHADLAEASQVLVDVDALVKTIPAEWQPIASAVLGLVGTADRTLQRFSQLAQAYSAGVTVAPKASAK